MMSTVAGFIFHFFNAERIMVECFNATHALSSESFLNSMFGFANTARIFSRISLLYGMVMKFVRTTLVFVPEPEILQSAMSRPSREVPDMSPIMTRFFFEDIL